MKYAISLSAVAGVLLAGCTVETETADMPAMGNNSDLTSFVGARAGQAEMGIQTLGFELIRTEGLTAFWFNRSTGACARIVTDQGRYASVDMIAAEDC